MSLEEARDNLKRMVVYRPHAGAEEVGMITRVTETHVFVDYVGSGLPKATNPEDLTLLSEVMGSK